MSTEILETTSREVASTTEPSPEFQLFSELPIELRLKIWEMCWIPTIARFEGKPWWCYQKTYNPNRTLLSVSKELRDGLLAKNHFLYSRPPEYTWGYATPEYPKILLNTQTDILDVSFPSGYASFPQPLHEDAPVRVHFASGAKQVQRLAIRLVAGSPSIKWEEFQETFPNAKELWVLRPTRIDKALPQDLELEDLDNIETSRKVMPWNDWYRDMMTWEFGQAQARGLCKGVQIFFGKV